MTDADLEKYCTRAVKEGATHAKQIQPSSIATASWVRLKCQFGCAAYDRFYSCPPRTPTPEQTREVIDSYHRAILFHIQVPQAPDRGKRIGEFLEMLRNLEGEMFKDGYYKAFVLLAGPCRLCDPECAKLEGVPCKFPDRARPSMEACGIDVFQTARNNGLPITALRERTETQNHYCVMLVD